MEGFLWKMENKGRRENFRRGVGRAMIGMQKGTCGVEKVEFRFLRVSLGSRAFTKLYGA